MRSWQWEITLRHTETRELVTKAIPMPLPDRVMQAAIDGDPTALARVGIWCAVNAAAQLGDRRQWETLHSRYVPVPLPGRRDAMENPN